MSNVPGVPDDRYWTDHDWHDVEHEIAEEEAQRAAIAEEARARNGTNGHGYNAPAHPKLRTVRIGDLVDTGPPKFMVQGLWLEQGAGIVGGDPKSWKSFFTVFMAVHVAAGRRLLNRFDCKQGRVVIFNAEDTANLTRFRIGCMCRALDIPIGDLDLHLIDTPALFLDDADHVELLRETVKDMRPELLILDPLRNLHSLDENDSAILPSVLTPLRLIQRDYGCAVQVIHHLTKAGEGRTMASRLRGTGALRGWYDSGLVLDRAEDGGPVKLTIEHRGAEGPDPFTIRLQKSPAPDGDGEAIWFEECEPPDRGSLEEQILAFKHAHPGVSGKMAIPELRALGVKFRNGEFWEIWK